MKNQKGFVVPLLLVIIAVLAIGGGVYIYNNEKANTVIDDRYNIDTTQQAQTQPAQNQQKTTGIVIEQPTLNQEVQLPITIKGYLNGNGWAAFEGVAGSVQVFDANNKSISAVAQLTATTDWMKPIVHFEATVGDRQMMSNLTTQTGVLVFKNENPKGGVVGDKEFRLPIKFANNKTSNWKTYTNSRYGFSIQYPTGTFVDESNQAQHGGTIVVLQPKTTNGSLWVSVEIPASNCYDTASGADPTYKTFNGINFIIWSRSKEFSAGLDTWATAREYCVVHNGIEYQILSKLPYKAGGTELNVDTDMVLNQILNSFKFTK